MSAEGVRLTKGERKLLKLAGQGEIDMTWEHPDGESLARHGLLALRHCVPGSAFVGGQVGKITPAGRAALTAETGGRNEGS